MINEYYANLKGYENIYEISCYGTIINVKTHRMLTPKYDKDGYLKVGLTKDGKQKYKFVHRLVATAFIPNPNNYNEVNHISGIKSCNCSKNLEWCNRSMNMIHAYKMGLCNKKNKGGDKNVIKLKSI